MKKPPGFFQCSDVWGEVVQSLSKEDMNHIEQTCHMLRKRIFDIKSGILREYVSRYAFGACKWEHYLGQVERIPLPLKLLDILESQCPFFWGRKVKDTHILFYLPKTVDGEPLTLNRLGELVKNPKQGHSTHYGNFFPAIKRDYGDGSTDAPCWVLMTRNVILESRNDSFSAQCALISRTQVYEVPKVLEMAVGVFSHYVATGKKLFSDAHRTYTRCQEQVDGWRVVGGFGASGLDVIRRYDNDGISAVAALRKFPGP